jgi:hypothetical protein
MNRWLALVLVLFAWPAPGVNPSHSQVLTLNLPSATLKGTPEDVPSGPNIEPYSDKAPPPFFVPTGVTNVAAGKSVTGSIKPFTGELSQITDGKKEAFDYDTVEMKKGSQWVQVDLGAPFAIYAVVMWHDHRYIQVIHDVIVQVSNDPEFKTDVTNLFNNDVDNSSGLGVGSDREYFETRYGKIVDGRGVIARYVRCYTKGGSLSALNCWQEIEVYGMPPALAPYAVIQPPVVQINTEAPFTVVASSESGHATAVAAVVQTASAQKPTQPAPVQVNVEAKAQVEVFPETVAPAKAAPPPPAAPATAGLNWTVVLLAAVALFGATFGVAYALIRASHAAASAKSK